MPGFWVLFAFCVIVVIMIIGRHVLLSVRRWRSTAWPRSLFSLAALSLRTAFLWYLVGVVIIFPFALSPHALNAQSPLNYIYMTVGLPLNIAKLVTWLPPLPGFLGSWRGSQGSWSYDVYSFVLFASFLYLISLISVITFVKFGGGPKGIDGKQDTHAV